MKIEQATIKDIARALQMSASTVSRALKDYPTINAETKRKVREMAEKLNYRPNAIALSLRHSRSFTIGVVIPEVVHFFFSTVISGIEEEAFARGYKVILTQSNEKLVREKSNLDTLLSNQIDGVLISFSKETTEFDHFSELLGRGFPIVFFDRIPRMPDALTVTVDDRQGAYAATQHLIEQGYRRIAHLAGPPSLDISRQRLEGYQLALMDHGIPPNPDLLAYCSEGTDIEAREISHRLLLSAAPPDAFFAHNDMTAVGAMMACRAAGLRVPEDVGVVGFSNWQFCAMLAPSLSSVDQPGFMMGKKSAQLLLDWIEKRLESPHQAHAVVLPTKLIPRESSTRKIFE